MNNFTFVSPTEFIFGANVATGIGEKLQALGFKRAMIVYGSNSAKKSGIVDVVLNSLSASGIDCVELSGVRPNPEV
ncbi:MAG: iron-containing alcohol dehydrogenase, partial [Eggerthellaceae bacterium]|nr:iron-containing alcohol dehydrogenase [Eggerthellaceae bacterium]